MCLPSCRPGRCVAPPTYLPACLVLRKPPLTAQDLPEPRPTLSSLPNMDNAVRSYIHELSCFSYTVVSHGPPPARRVCGVAGTQPRVPASRLAAQVTIRLWDPSSNCPLQHSPSRRGDARSRDRVPCSVPVAAWASGAHEHAGPTRPRAVGHAAALIQFSLRVFIGICS